MQYNGKLTILFTLRSWLDRIFLSVLFENLQTMLLITIPTNYTTILQRRYHRERNMMSALQPFLKKNNTIIRNCYRPLAFLRKILGRAQCLYNFTCTSPSSGARGPIAIINTRKFFKTSDNCSKQILIRTANKFR